MRQINQVIIEGIIIRDENMLYNGCVILANNDGYTSSSFDVCDEKRKFGDKLHNGITVRIVGHLKQSLDVAYIIPEYVDMAPVQENDFQVE